jgi:hypothetical protein
MVWQAQVHIRRIVMEFGPYPLGSLRPSQIRLLMTRLGEEGLEDSYIYALHARLAQIMNDAVHDGLLAKSPCSRRTSPLYRYSRTQGSPAWWRDMVLAGSGPAGEPVAQGRVSAER